MTTDQKNAWFNVVDTCKSIGFSFERKKYKYLSGKEAICMFIKDLKKKQQIKLPCECEQLFIGCAITGGNCKTDGISKCK